ncbi:ATP-binding protein [Archangium sp.]|uniref:ATP-binding protein n=1 Tax=Archangium sp. TaxID=1872627 RepID=UPI002D3F0291|nr:ATP-binding protein [Archangium sp.]HYO53037.1 ATP-binding protein [Archangium sp.]
MNAPPVDVIDKLGTLGLRAAPEALRSLLESSTRGRASPTEVCERLVELERRARDTTNLDRRTRAATLGTFCTLDRFDWNHPRSIDKSLYERLLTLDFLEKGHNVLLRGQSGVGKTAHKRDGGPVEGSGLEQSIEVMKQLAGHGRGGPEATSARW